MSDPDPIAEIERRRLLAIVRLAQASDDVPVALEAGGVRTMELSLLSGSALRTIERWRHRFPTLTIGAGTVLSASDAKAAIDAGAQFLVSPDFDEDVAECASATETGYIPGAMTPSECHRCARAGVRLIKLFPATTLGPSYLRELAGPFPGLHLMPTGGVDAENAEDFLRAGATALAVGGGLVSDGTTSEMIERRARALVATIASIQQGEN